MMDELYTSKSFGWRILQTSKFAQNVSWDRFLCMHWSNEKHGRGHYCKNLKIICIFYLSHDIDALNDVIRREGKLEQDGGFGW